MTVRVGTSVVAGSGADAQEVNSLIESVNALTAKVEELTKKLESGSLGGSDSGNLSENVTLTIILRSPCEMHAYDSSVIANNSAYLRVNGTNHYSKIVGKPVSIDYKPVDVSYQTQVPRNSVVLVEAFITTNYNSTAYDSWGCLSQALVAKDHCVVVMENHYDRILALKDAASFIK